jgi:hypothetical protein
VSWLLSEPEWFQSQGHGSGGEPTLRLSHPMILPRPPLISFNASRNRIARFVMAPGTLIAVHGRAAAL